MTKTNEPLTNNLELREDYSFSKKENQTFSSPPKTNKSRRWKYTKPDLQVFCFLCAKQFSIKYVLPKKQYSQKNNWGYWTGKENFKDQHVCDDCLTKIHKGGIIHWVNNLEKADIFYTYLSRRTIR